MKNIFYILVLIAFGVTSCHDEPDWLGDNTETEGRHFPVIGTLSASETIVATGDMIELDMRFWSLDPIKETEVIEKLSTADEYNVVETIPYTFNFNEETQDEQLIINYTAPSVADTMVYQVGARVINENGLTRERVVDITVIPN